MKKFCLALAVLCSATIFASAQKTFYSSEFKVGFKYPATMRLSTKSDDLIVMDQSLKGLAKVALRKTGPGIYEAAGTLAAGAMTQKDCKALSANDDPQRKRIGTLTFDKTEVIEGGMESVHPMEFYRVYNDGTCYEVRLEVSQNKYPKRRVNDQAAFTQLYAVLQTMFFGK